MNFTNRQLEIIKKAMILIDKGGLTYLTTKKLAVEMGFSEPALYRHFKNKEEILNSVLLHYKAQMRLEMSAISEIDKSGLEQLMKIIEYQFLKFKKIPAIIMVIFSELSFQNHSLLLNTISKIIDQKEERIKLIIQTGQKDGSIKKEINSSNLADILMGSMRFVALRWKLSGFAFNLEHEAKLLKKSFSTMIGTNKKI